MTLDIISDDKTSISNITQFISQRSKLPLPPLKVVQNVRRSSVNISSNNYNGQHTINCIYSKRTSLINGITQCQLIPGVLYVT